VHENYKKFQCQACDFGFWKIMAGRQFETAEAEALLRERAVGPLDGFRSKLGRPFSASIKLNDELAVKFDFEDGPDDDAEAPDFSAQEPLGECPKCGARVFEHGQSYVCEKATGPAKSCDFRSGRLILQRPIEPAQMKKLLATGKTDLLQFVSARTRRPFSAFLVRQPDGKIGFEFEAKAGGKGARGARGGAPLRVLGPHPDDQAPVELHAGRYGPYVKHGSVNATLPDRDKVDSLTLDEALAILAEKIERGGGTAPAKRAAKAKTAKATGTAKPRAKPATTAAEPAAPKAAKQAAGKTAAGAAKKAAAKRPAARKAPGKTAARTASAKAAPRSPTARKK
jgi:DNA topoisomerase-3